MTKNRGQTEAVWQAKARHPLKARQGKETFSTRVSRKLEPCLEGQSILDS